MPLPGHRRESELALLKFLERTNLITSAQAQAGEVELASGDETQTAIDWVTRRGLLSEEEIADALCRHLRLPFANLAAVTLNPGITNLLRETVATRYHVVPIRGVSGDIAIATANPLDSYGLRAVEFATGGRVRVEVATQTALRDALQHAYHLDESLDAYLKGIPEAVDVPVAATPDAPGDLRQLMRETDAPPVVKLFNLILMEALKAGASDTHIEPIANGLRVRQRIDGILEESFLLPKWIQDPLIARCKVLARLDITERRVPQDGRICVSYRNGTIDLRVSSLPTQFGEKVTMRILNAETAPQGLDPLGLSPADCGRVRAAMSRPEGMIFVTGPTGSGKTTTLYGILAELVSPTTNIVTIENPIEYQLPGINQVEINEKQGLTFAGTLRSILRQDPDVILVGEVRDRETAEIALQAAQTGHLVLSTLHTNDAAASITRLINLGIEPYMLASSLHLIIAQRLVRRVCPHCVQPYRPAPAMLAKLRTDPDENGFRAGTGCRACRRSGYAGRVGVFEVMVIDGPIAALIERRTPEATLRLHACGEGMHTLAQHAMELVRRGVTSVEEVMRVVDVLEEGVRCPSCGEAIDPDFSLCPQCGTALQSNCTGCGRRLQRRWRLCPQCGKAAESSALSPAAAPPPSPAPAPAPSVATADDGPVPTPAEPVGRPAGGQAHFKVLVVDDQQDFRFLVSATLEASDLPVEVLSASDGMEALQRVREEAVHLVLLDVMMPDMDGFEVCAKLRADVRTAFIPIIMLTALNDTSSRSHGFLVGTDDYIGKPFSADELVARVRRILTRTYGHAPRGLA